MLKQLKPNKYILTGIFIIILCAVFLLPNFVFALDWGEQYGQALGLGSGDPRVIAVSIIRVALTFVGIIAVVLIMYGGFLWMTSEGDPAKLDKAKSVLRNAVIGLIIMMLSWAIVTFILIKLNQGMFGLPGPAPGPPDDDGGLGALGSCTIESVYPEPHQKEVPRNTGIIVTFREEVDPITVCGADPCNNSLIIPDRARIFKVVVGDSCEWGGANWINCDVSNVIDVNVTSTDNKIFVFMPVNYLGSPSEYIDYAVYLSNDIRKLADSSGVFDTCSTDFFQWQFEVSNKIDLTPPQVTESGVFPAPDNEQDEVGEETAAVQATGSITVDSQPKVYVAATAQNPPTKIGLSEDATVNGTYICQDDGIITVSINGGTDQSDVSGPIGVVTGDDITDNVASLGCGLTLTSDDGTFTAGDSWTIVVTAEAQADTLTVGSVVYIFGVDIDSDSNNNTTANNIVAALVGHSDVTVAAALNVVTITAKVAGVAGNNIVLATSNATTLNITLMSGGQDKEVTTTVKDRRDKPRNAVIQVNFNEAINPITVSGNAAEVANWIRVKNDLRVNGDICIQDKECASNNCVGTCVGVAALLNAGAGCSSDRECLSFNCDAGSCNGNELAGKFMISNQYRTVEFVSDNLCGVNGCGEQIYCLPENSHLKVELIAAGLANCPGDIDCGTVAPFTNCNIHCQDADNKNYPVSAMPLNGIADMAMNSLDGDRSEDAEGPIGFYNENIAAGLGDNYQWSFFISDLIDLAPPVINLVDPAHNVSGISLTDPILINFSKVMMSSSLSTGSTVIFNGQDYVTHQLINLWNFTGQPVGYWVANDNIDDSPADGEPDWTKAQLKHSMFADTTSYRAQVGSGVKDIYQNCFKPSEGPACVATPVAPNCCLGAPGPQQQADSCP